MTEKEKKERHDIFSADYKKRQNFFRKSNIYRITIIVAILGVFIWGSRDYIYSYISNIEIRDIFYHHVSYPVLDKSGKSSYLVFNRSSYNILLEISCNAGNFTTTYNDTVLIPNQIIYISFKGIVKGDTEIVIKGVKVG